MINGLTWIVYLKIALKPFNWCFLPFKIIEICQNSDPNNTHGVFSYWSYPFEVNRDAIENEVLCELNCTAKECTSQTSVWSALSNLTCECYIKRTDHKYCSGFYGWQFLFHTYAHITLSYHAAEFVLSTFSPLVFLSLIVKVEKMWKFLFALMAQLF